MKKIETPRTVYDVTYEARDGKVFDKKEFCQNHENLLDFQEFILDRDKLFGELTQDNWKHYMYEFLQLFAYHAESDVHLLQEEKFEEHIYEKGKEKKVEFSLDKVKNFFISEFYMIQDYEREYEKQKWNDRNYHTTTRRLYKEVVDFVSLYRFMFETGLLKFEDVFLKVHVPYYVSIEKDEEVKKKQYNEYFYSFVFIKAFERNSPEILDIAIKHLNFNLIYFIENWTLGGGKWRLNLDFISTLAIGESDEYRWIGIMDDYKRVKWVEYLLKKDLPIQLFRYKTSNSKDKEKQIINPPITQLISEIKEEESNPYTYIFKKNHKKMIELFENCGPNFKKANESNKLPKFYELTAKACEIFKKIYSAYPEIQILEDGWNLFKYSRVIEEDMSVKAKNAKDYRKSKEVEFAFHLAVLNQDHEGKKDICVITINDVKSYYDKNKNTKTIVKVIDLKTYLGKPEKLAMELAYQLNLCTPLGLTASEKVSEIDAKLFELEKKKEALLKEEEILRVMREDSSVNIGRKKK